MDESPDPIHQFFSSPAASLPNILYTSLHVTPTATPEEIRKSYRRLALQYHPDKHASKSEQQKQDTNREFHRIGFAYAVLSDEARRSRYDSTGRTDESAFTDAETMGWDAYFQTLYQRIDRSLLDEDKIKYQNSQDERGDLVKAYNLSKGSWPKILLLIPHSTNDDEIRLINIVNDLIDRGDLERTKLWAKTSTDDGAAATRGKAAAKEAQEAEAAAKELGVWDEFYGNGKKGKRMGDKVSGEDALASLITKRQKERANGLDALADKYRRMEDTRSKKKRSRAPEKEPEISDADFEALQARMFGGGHAK